MGRGVQRARSSGGRAMHKQRQSEGKGKAHCSLASFFDILDQGVVDFVFGNLRRASVYGQFSHCT